RSGDPRRRESAATRRPGGSRRGVHYFDHARPAAGMADRNQEDRPLRPYAPGFGPGIFGICRELRGDAQGSDRVNPGTDPTFPGFERHKTWGTSGLSPKKVVPSDLISSLAHYRHARH